MDRFECWGNTREKAREREREREREKEACQGGGSLCVSEGEWWGGWGNGWMRE